MTLSDLSIKRPVFAWMLMFGLIVFGAISFGRMGVSELPDIDFPMISVAVRFEGAAPEVIEADVVDPIEDALVSIQGVKDVSSVSRNGGADITVEFQIDRNIDLAFQDVQAKLASIQAMLPAKMDPITIMKINPEDFPIMWLSVASSTMTRPELMLYVKDEVRDKLTTVPGVGNLWMPGYLSPNLRIWVDNKALTQYALTVDDVVNTVRSEHLEPPSGRTEFNKKEISLRTMGESRTIPDFEKTLINTRGGGPNFAPITIGKVAKIEEGTMDAVQFARANQQFAVGLGVVKQRGANAVSVAQAIKKRLEAIKDTLPKGTEVVVNYDGTKFVEESIHELVLTLILAAIFTSVVCWFFLGTWASTLNVLLAIPTSVLGSFIILAYLNFTLNLFTLLGLSLAIGIVVDDAIMVLENIIRHREMGKSRREAAIVGAREITFAAMAASVSLVAIFLPIALIDGMIGQFLFQFGVTLSAAVMISLLEALTLTPMRAALFNDAETKGRSKIGMIFENGFEKLRARYEETLAKSLQHRWKTLGAGVLFFFLSIGSVAFLKGEFAPAQDMGSIMILLNNPPGSGISLTDEVVGRVEKFLHSRSEVAATFVAAGGFSGGEPHAAMIFVDLKKKGKRGKDPVKGHELSQLEFIDVVREELKKSVPDAKPQVQDPSQQGFGGGGSKGFPAEFMIQGPDWHQLGDFSKEIITQLKKREIMTDVESDLLEGAPELRIVPNRQKASERGVSVEAIGTVVNAMLGGVVAGSYEMHGHRNDIRVKMVEENRSPTELIRELMVRNNRGQLVPLISVVDVKEGSSPATVSRKNRQRSIMIYGNLGKGKSQQEVLKEAETIVKEIMSKGGEGYRFILVGTAEEMMKSFLSLIFALLLGFVVAYMVLASQFNSFIDPVTVFMALPFSFSGAFLGLLITGQTLNMYSMIGLVLLMGIVKKNSILLVDFTHQKRSEGKKSVIDALVEACPTRLRPILMTSFATIAGAMPAALAFGPGAETRRPMAISVIGGVLVSTFLTLYVVPSVYSLLSRFEGKKHEE